MKHLPTLILSVSLAIIGTPDFASAQSSGEDSQKERRIQMWLNDQDKNLDGK